VIVRGAFDFPGNGNATIPCALPARIRKSKHWTVVTLSAVTPNRIVPLAGVSNFRDLGGYQTSDGRVTRWEKLYRSDALHDLTEPDLLLFRNLGIVTIVDLRNVTEVERSGRGLLDSEGIRFISAPVLPENDMERREMAVLDDDYLTNRYLHYLEVGDSAFVRAIQEMAAGTNYPLVFNCFFGKDRTGVLAALVLSCLSVNRSEIVDDYALTATRVPLILQRLKADPVYRETIERTDPILLAAQAATISRFLVELDRRFGSARDWALGVGISSVQLAALEDQLLE
jgi:protein-tyrosine phosphatase